MSLHIMKFDPKNYPPFPDDIGPCTQLEILSFKKLIDNDDEEQAKLLGILLTKGFFILDFNSTDVASLGADAEDICEQAQALFDLPTEEKLSYSMGTYKPHSLHGYKRAGTTLTDSAGSRDTAEFWDISKDDILETPGSIRVKYPSLVTEAESKSRIAKFQTECHETGLTIMSIVASRLGLPPDAFSKKHRLDKPSDDHIRITFAPPRKTPNQPELSSPGHTDFGLITLLFNWQGGLQIWSEPSRGNFHQVFDGAQSKENEHAAEWLWVKPKPGCAIINLGDAAVKFTGGLLCSARHRVVPAPGDQGLFARYSLVYFVRPEDDAVLKRLEGGMVPRYGDGEEEPEYTTRQWIEKQYKQLQEGKARND